MNKYISPPNIYVFFALGHALCNALNLNVLLIRALYVPFYLLSFYYFIKAINECEFAKYMKILTILFGMIGVYSVFFLIFGSDHTWVRQYDPIDYCFMYFESIVPIYVFYYFGMNGMIDDNWFKRSILFFIIVVYANYLNMKHYQMSIQLNNPEEITNNGGYYWTALLPMTIFLREKPWLQYIVMIFVSIMVLICFKRGAVFIAFLIDAYIIYKTFRTSSIEMKVLSVILLFFAFLAMSSVVDYLVSHSDYFMLRVNQTLEGDSSNRDNLYLGIISFLDTKFSVFHILFGYGANGTLHYVGKLAHQDWLELLFDYGILGVVIYLAYWVVFFKECKYSLLIDDSSISIALTSIFILYFTKSMFSMSINGMDLYATSILGYGMAKVYLARKDLELEEYEQYYYQDKDGDSSLEE